MGCNAANGGSAGRQSVTTTTSLLSRAEEGTGNTTEPREEQLCSSTALYWEPG